METSDELQVFLTKATQDGVWGRLLDRGAAWSIMRQAGVLPEDAPPLGEQIDIDLAEHGFSILRAALSLRELDGTSALCQRAFERAGNAFESLVRNGAPDAEERGFYRTIAGAAYHLAGYSAIAYSLFGEQQVSDLNANAAEGALILLILRDLDRLRTYVKSHLLDEDNGDASVSVLLEDGEIDSDEAISIVLNTVVCRALAFFDFALQTGEVSLLDTAKELLDTALDLADAAASVSLWWIVRLCRNMLDDLWAHSLHETLPSDPPEGGEGRYVELRRLFIASLYARRSAELELWPSQREAAKRSTDVSDDLVVALPTSAGKTRIAEIAALMCLSGGKRVLIVTPLRALSAQTERTFRQTFSPLGFSVSSLYGASGLSAGDEDALRSMDIIIATPEKLDFALRNDASLIDDIGLVVLDEGHLIGPTEREIRYEILVQKLLRRADAGARRIVCLSAILPDGQQLEDLTAWIRKDVEGEPVRSSWRPTRQRFGALVWKGDAATLNYDLEDQGPFLARFVEQIPARAPEKKPYPRKTKDLTLFAAWRFAQQGKRTLIFSTQANWVEGYGESAVELHRRGYLPTLLDDEALVQRALEVGQEWLGDQHPAVACLKLGVAVHHGRLPSPFLRELEALLAKGVLKVIVASPTLSQGLNLNAAVLLVPYLVRAGKVISGEEFANVAGRAGRAFVDVEGLVVHVILDKPTWRLTEWRKLVKSAKARTLQSGLYQIIAEIIGRLAQEGVLERADAIEYLSSSREAWKSQAEENLRLGIADPPADADDEEEEKIEEEPMSHLVEKLDATVLGLVEALDADSEDLPRLLDEALQGSLWARQIGREDEDEQQAHKAILEARANVIWSHTTPDARKGHYAMGVGLEAGLAIDGMADVLGDLLDQADEAALRDDGAALSAALAQLAARLLVIRPFVPDKKNTLPANWAEILEEWVSGTGVDVIGPENMRIIEDAFAYRLVWALEALRTRRVTLGWSSEIVSGGGAASVETGVPQLMMSMLIRAGLPSRRAAMAAIRTTGADFFTIAGMREWLASEEIEDLTNAEGFPTPETAVLWQRFRDEMLSGAQQKWSVGSGTRALSLRAADKAPAAGIYRIEIDAPHGEAWLTSPDFRRVAKFKTRVQGTWHGLLAARLKDGQRSAQIERFGPGKVKWPT
ncbi:DEAD/DEAH box helicase [Xenophilus arseniciresistens]|uniref:DEAD/DEAH box helicase n=1 Tax=Xenophilus arseniciresistens TaxID=1283306 RepID=A0AAE3NC20_9BURK|nr:DEAD/DEAH box helicase [Xenophilus arseniciresistens]MDA7418076.1 DEAD/DEAH box helicase [Xenophilus arseniciresistens]